jgi:hypothetical protein
MNTHKIIFKDGKVEYLNESEYFKTEKAGIANPGGSFFIGTNKYTFDDIRRMQSIDKRPIFNVNQYVKNKDPKARLWAIKSIGIGLKKYIGSERYRGTQAPVMLLDKVREVYQLNK